MLFNENYIRESSLCPLIESQRFNSNYFIGTKDSQLRLGTISQATANLLNIKHLDDVKGLTDEEFLGSSSPTSPLIPDYIFQDKKVLLGNKLTIFDLIPIEEGFIACLTDRIPIIDSRASIIGSCFCSKLVTGKHLPIKVIHAIIKCMGKPGISMILHEENLLIEPNSLDEPRWELEIMWLLAQGMTTKMIAAYLSRSQRTIEDHIERLKEKYACANKPELIQKIMQMGIQGYLPKSLINTKTIQLFQQ